MKRIWMFLASFGVLFVVIYAFRQPKREVRLIFEKRRGVQGPRVAHSTARPLPLRSLVPLKKALQSLGKLKGLTLKKAKKLQRLPTGELLMGFADGKKPGEHRLRGFRMMIRDRKGAWKPFLGGRSIFEVRSAKSGWSTAMTALSDLYLRAPSGQMELLKKRVGLQPRFSSSGRFLAYVHRQSIAHHTLLWRDLQAAKEWALVSREAVSEPIISPKEDAVIYTSARTGIASLWKTDLQGKSRQQLTNRGLAPGAGRPPKGFVPPPMGRYPALWAGRWLVYDAGDGLWAVRDDGTGARLLAKGNHRPRWHVPGRSVLLLLPGQKHQIIPLETQP